MCKSTGCSLPHCNSQIIAGHRDGPRGLNCNLTEHQINNETLLIASSSELFRDCVMEKVHVYMHGYDRQDNRRANEVDHCGRGAHLQTLSEMSLFIIKAILSLFCRDMQKYCLFTLLWCCRTEGRRRKKLMTGHFHVTYRDTLSGWSRWARQSTTRPRSSEMSFICFIISPCLYSSGEMRLVVHAFRPQRKKRGSLNDR